MAMYEANRSETTKNYLPLRCISFSGHLLGPWQRSFAAVSATSTISRRFFASSSSTRKKSANPILSRSHVEAHSLFKFTTSTTSSSFLYSLGGLDGLYELTSGLSTGLVFPSSPSTLCLGCRLAIRQKITSSSPLVD